MKENADRAISWVLLDEGGYAERESEPGGAVNRGITQQLYRRYCQQTHQPIPAEHDFTQLKAMTEAEAREIYRTMVLDPLRFDEMPAGVDYALLDFVVNSGQAGALRALRTAFALPDQRRVWALEDELVATLNGDPKSVIDRICEARLRVMKNSKSWPWAQRGWVPRVNRARLRSYSLAGVGEPSPTAKLKARSET